MFSSRLLKRIALALAVLVCTVGVGVAPASASTVTPDGGTATNYCHDLKANGKAVDWEMYYKPVAHSIPTHGYYRTVYCLNPKWDNYDCMAAVSGLAFTLLGYGAGVRVVLALAGGVAVSLPGIWKSC